MRDAAQIFAWVWGLPAMVLTAAFLGPGSQDFRARLLSLPDMRRNVPGATPQSIKVVLMLLILAWPALLLYMLSNPARTYRNWKRRKIAMAEVKESGRRLKTCSKKGGSVLDETDRT